MPLGALVRNRRAAGGAYNYGRSDSEQLQFIRYVSYHRVAATDQGRLAKRDGRK